MSRWGDLFAQAEKQQNLAAQPAHSAQDASDQFSWDRGFERFDNHKLVCVLAFIHGN